MFQIPCGLRQPLLWASQRHGHELDVLYASAFDQHWWLGGPRVTDEKCSPVRSAFDQDLGGWAVQSVTDMRYMFASPRRPGPRLVRGRRRDDR